MSHTGSWVWDVRSGAPVYWSPEMWRIYGREPGHAPPTIDECRTLHPPEGWAGWLAAVQRSARDKTEIDFACRLELADGLVRHIRIAGHPILGGAEEVTEIIGSTTEIDGRRPQPRAKVETSADPLRQVIDRMPALAWSCLPDGSAEFFNRGWLEYTGLSEQEALGWGWTAAFHPDDVSAVLLYWQSLLAAPKPGEIEARLRRSDGEFRWFLFRTKPLLNETGKTVRWYGTNTDIDDRKSAEEALRESERQLHQLVETIPALIWRGTAQGELDYLNQRHIVYLGKTAESLSNGRWLDLVHPDDRDATIRRWLHSAETGAPYEDIYRLRRADGQYRWIQSVGAPYRDTEGRITHWYGMVSDIDDRKSVEDALRESERELRQLVDSVPGMIAVANSQGQHEYANKRALDYTGTTLEESRGLGFIQTIHPEEQDLVMNQWLQCSVLGKPMAIDHRWRRFDGVYRWFHVRVDPLLDDRGQVVRWYGLLTDIEDQKRAEEAFRKGEQRLRLLVETIPALLWRAAPNGEIDYVNQRVLDYTGLCLEELQTSGWAPLLHPDDVASAMRTWRDDCEAGTSHEVTYRLRRADGEYRWFQVRGEPLRDTDGRILNWYGLMLDIDDRKRAEQALREREAHLRGVLETMPALVSRSTPDGKLEYVNQRFVGYLGETLEQIGFHSVHPDDRDNHLKKHLNALQTGEAWENTYRIRRADGQYRWFYVGVEPLRDHVGRVVNWYAVNVDIHDGREMEETLRSTRRRLSAAMQIATVAELSASIAHEINQPLASVVSNGHACVTWLSSDPPNLERARLTVERVIRDGNAASEVVGRIRALFKQAAPAMALSDINGIIVEVLRLIADEIRDSGISVETELEAGLPSIVVDRVQIQQTLINLAHNAIEAMGGVTDRPKELLVTSRRDGIDLRIQVRDNGCGIASPASIFDAFFTTKEHGMGMGLAICRSIVEAHGGRLWSTPNESAGTTFSLTLPLHPDVSV